MPTDSHSNYDRTNSVTVNHVIKFTDTKVMLTEALINVVKGSHHGFVM